MSKSANMLRTRRRDNNLKPNRRLDRKSSRGMLYENEELRLKTININAEVERGQSDIKKLKRENDQLRREIWYLRDEYDKLDKLLRDKDHPISSSSSSSSSESESCSSYTEECDAVETSQNLENVQKTNLKKLNQEFDHLSIVPEENSTENSDKNSGSNALSVSDQWKLEPENGIIQPDQSYPVKQNLLASERIPKHFFSPIKTNKSIDDYINNQFLGPEVTYSELLYPHHEQYYENVPEMYQNDPRGFTPHPNYFQSITLPSLSKTGTDVIVKTDNQNFNSLKSRSSFSNGGNLEELLNDIESISHDILKISNSQNTLFLPPTENEIISAPNAYNPRYNNNDDILPPDRPYKSELNVVLIPTPMQLIEIEKYKNIKKSCESLPICSLESLSASYQDFASTEMLHEAQIETFQTFVPVPPMCPGPETHLQSNDQPNPLYYENIYDNGRLCNAPEKEIATPSNPSQLTNHIKDLEICNSKTNLLETAVSSEPVSSENEENLKFKTSRHDNDKPVEKISDKTSIIDQQPTKTGIKQKVSIHFKGRKDKTNKKKVTPDDKPKTPQQEKKHSFFDLKFSSDKDNKKVSHQKTPSMESKNSVSAILGTCELKSSSDNKQSKPTDSSSMSDQKSFVKTETKMTDRKSRKSSSVSPERKHAHKETKKHKKHKKSELLRNRRNSVSAERLHRERSYSVCTDRSNMLERSRIGLYSMYDDFTTSDRERTNSLSSCDTLKGRKLSNISHFQVSGKIPWCGCWGNGCL